MDPMMRLVLRRFIGLMIAIHLVKLRTDTRKTVNLEVMLKIRPERLQNALFSSSTGSLRINLEIPNGIPLQNDVVMCVRAIRIKILRERSCFSE
jgi:hypothetical protein